MLRLVATLCLLVSLLGCYRLGVRGPTEESRVDAELTRPIPPSPTAVVPTKPQKGFEQESPKAQSP